MRTLLKAAAALSFIGATAIGATSAVQAQGLYLDAPGIHVGVGDPYHDPYRQRRYYDYDYRGGGTYNGCPPGYTVQGGNCAPYKGPVGPGVPRGARYPWQ